MGSLQEEIYLIAIASLFLLIVGAGICFVFFTYKKKQKELIFQKEQQQLRFEKELLLIENEIKEDIYKNISLELHNNICQVLVTVNNTVKSLNNTEKEKVSLINNQLGRAIQDLRLLSRGLNNDYFSKLGLEESIAKELNILSKSGKLEIIYSCINEIDGLDEKRGLIVFRIFQEIISNAVRHSNATQLTIEILNQDNTILFSISDNGVGFDIDKSLTSGEGSGLYSLTKRSKLIDAQLDFLSKVGEGTTVNLLVRKESSVNE